MGLSSREVDEQGLEREVLCDLLVLRSPGGSELQDSLSGGKLSFVILMFVCLSRLLGSDSTPSIVSPTEQDLHALCKRSDDHANSKLVVRLPRFSCTSCPKRLFDLLHCAIITALMKALHKVVVSVSL